MNGWRKWGRSLNKTQRAGNSKRLDGCWWILQSSHAQLWVCLRVFLRRYEVRAYRLGRLPGTCLLKIHIMLGRITTEPSSSDGVDGVLRGASGVGISSKPQRKTSALNKRSAPMSFSQVLCLFFLKIYYERTPELCYTSATAMLISVEGKWCGVDLRKKKSRTRQKQVKKTQQCTTQQRLSKPTALTLSCSVINQPLGQDEIRLDHWLLIHFVVRSDGWSSLGRSWQPRQTSSRGSRLLHRHGNVPRDLILRSPVTM